MAEKQKVIMWVVIGLCGAAIIVYLGVSGNLTAPSQNAVIPSSSVPAGEIMAPIEVPASGVVETPKASEPIKAADIPAKAVKLSVSASGFSPSSFDVDTGDKIMLAITSGDQYTHTFSFDSPLLSNFAVGLSAGETRTIEFIVPAKGEYIFRCGLPGHADRGEVGKMIAK